MQHAAVWFRQFWCRSRGILAEHQEPSIGVRLETNRLIDSTMSAGRLRNHEVPKPVLLNLDFAERIVYGSSGFGEWDGYPNP